MKRLVTMVSAAILSVFLFMGMFTEVQASSWPTVRNVAQSGLDTTSITVTWTGENAVSYNVYYRDPKTYEYKLVGNTTQTTYKITNLSEGMKYAIKVEGVNAEQDKSSGYCDAVTLAKKLSNVNQDRWWHFIEQVDIKWDSMTALDGYEYTMKNASGKTISRGKGTTKSSGVTFSVKNNQIYTFKVRGYMTVGGKKYYTAWTTINCFEQAWMKSLKASSGSLKIAWTSVKGATGYDVYVSTKKASGYVKVKSVGKNTTSLTIKKLKKKKISKKTNYYVYVVTKKGKNTSGVNYIWDSKRQGKSFLYR